MRRLCTLLVACVVVVTACDMTSSNRDTPSKPIPERSSAQLKRPNIILITMDDMRADELRYMPAVKRLIGEQGYRFTRAYSTFPQCCPARTSILTGQYAHNHGVMSNSFASGGGYEQFLRTVRPEDTLGVLLQRAGYRTSFVGKFLNGYARNDLGKIPAGWDAWRGLVGDSVYNYAQQNFNADGELWTSTKHNTRSITQLSIDQMKPAKRPFFVWMNYLAPHSGYSGDNSGNPQPLARDRNAVVPKLTVVEELRLDDKPSFVRNRRQITDKDWQGIAQNHTARVRSIIGVDRKIGQMIEHLKSNNLLEDTVIIFHSDNGFMLGEHGLQYGKNVPYEPATKVPLVLRGPGIPVGVTSTMVTLQDVTATIVSLSGSQPKQALDGISLSQVMTRGDLLRDRPILYEAGPTFSSVARGIKVGYGERFFTAIHYRRWVYIRYSNGEEELYDLRTDPRQMRSLHLDQAYNWVKFQLATELNRLQDCLGMECNRLFNLQK